MSSSANKRIAAIDLGSNSFHMTLAEITDAGLITHHKEKCKVRLAAGLDEQLQLSEQSIDKALMTLTEFGNLLGEFNPLAVFAVGTFTFRTATNIDRLIEKARAVMPYNIDILSGDEEARLIYQGVSQRANIDKPTLVIDIGGGSTELIIGLDNKPQILQSVGVGCVSLTHNFFTNNRIDAQIFDGALAHSKTLMADIKSEFQAIGWQQALGTSGSIKALTDCAKKLELSDGTLTLDTLSLIKFELLKAQSIDSIQLPGIAADRLPVICGGLAVLLAAFETFNIDRLQYCDAALREGLLFEAQALLSNH